MDAGRIKATDIRRKLAEQNGRCLLTGEELTPVNISADHMVPVSRGGAHALENIALVTLEANAAKGTLTPEEFVSLCRKVVEHHDRKQKDAASQEEVSEAADRALSEGRLFI